MTTLELLDYLHGYRATEMLAEELARLCAMRGRPDLVPLSLYRSVARRVAS